MLCQAITCIRSVSPQTRAVAGFFFLPAVFLFQRAPVAVSHIVPFPIASGVPWLWLGGHGRLGFCSLELKTEKSRLSDNRRIISSDLYQGSGARIFFTGDTLGSGFTSVPGSETEMPSRMLKNTFLLLCSAYVMWRTLGDVWTKCA